MLCRRCDCGNVYCADLGVTKSFSRPRVSNDNPFSESQFKTLKYRPEYPGDSDLSGSGYAGGVERKRWLLELEGSSEAGQVAMAFISAR